MLQPSREGRKANQGTGEHLTGDYIFEMHGVHQWEGQHLAAFPLIFGTFVIETKINVSRLYIFLT